jgi:hypothetical protein
MLISYGTGLPFMPKPSKSQTKFKTKKKPKAEPEPKGITTKPLYWVMLTIVLAVATTVVGFTTGFSGLQTAILVAAIVVLFGVVGYLRVKSSTLSFGKRATFIFAGVSVIGFGIWAAFILISNATGATAQIGEALGGQIFITSSLVICLTIGALIGELIGRNKQVQERLFPQKL